MQIKTSYFSPTTLAKSFSLNGGENPYDVVLHKKCRITNVFVA